MKELTYEGTTYNSKNPIARFAHRQRFKISLTESGIKPGCKVLDYGCGDGKFLDSIKIDCTKIGYEPYMDAMPGNTVKIFNSADLLKSYIESNGLFDVIVCFEVMEHLNEKNQDKMLTEMRSMLKENGTIVISVPIEISLPSVIKNLRRRSLYRDPQYSILNILKSALALPLRKYRESDGYLCHMGFNHKHLEKVVEKNFTIKKIKNSPFKQISHHFNSQRFYTITPL